MNVPNQKDFPKILALHTARLMEQDKAIGIAWKLLDATAAAVMQVCERDPALHTHAEMIRQLRQSAPSLS